MGDTKSPDTTGLSMDPFPRSPLRFSLNEDSFQGGSPSSASITDHLELVRVKRCAAQVVINSSAKILQLYGVQLVLLGTSLDPDNGCEYCVYRLEAATHQGEGATDHQPPMQIASYSVQVSCARILINMIC